MPEIKLDAKDKRLLYELDMGARQANSQLAKKIGLSKQAVQYRINRLQNNCVIQGFYPVINVPKLGYCYCRITLTLKDITEEERKSMMDDLIKDTRFFWIFTTQGLYDLLLVTWAKSITEFKKTVEDLLIRYGSHIESLNQSIATDVIHYQHRYLLNRKETEEIHIRETSERIEIDELDKKILRELCNNGRENVVDIAKKVDASSRMIAYRIRRMEKLGLIEGYRVIIDHKLIDYTYYKLWIDLHNFTSAELKKIKEYVKHQPCTIYIVEGIGLPEILDIEIMVKSNKELFEYVKELRNNFPRIVGHYKSFMFIDTLKVKYYPFE